ncbi:uncharacterized protein LOC124644334 isoform X1 [Helicoverpa zea]|uniref:uncharacterized protein LOC124632095 isoform X1 n=1 Tax=Helicoverpa zea TaxID=7113 RepID=UPI001F55F711|nr:uncharacterized protein LOC124632095 isoform X1 [Helicoverpa zea]XP_047025235.1 uncharacterized protein LOC124633909 isoform X1 [Helicoverpa zea]XP_047039596.1 uncharacterized protein LOC124644334 isoform X1 [Helicoverpa zea]XP_049698733.1 uncharacterized protein LOC126055092 isoform X1 [Helicoverpa armigera]
MDRNKPPDPDPPDISLAPPSPNYPLSQFADVVCSIADSQIPSHSDSQSSSHQNGRKRSGDENNAPNHIPSKQQRNQIGRNRYSATDKAPFIVHVSRLESQPNAVTADPAHFSLQGYDLLNLPKAHLETAWQEYWNVSSSKKVPSY